MVILCCWRSGFSWSLFIYDVRNLSKSGCVAGGNPFCWPAHWKSRLLFLWWLKSDLGLVHGRLLSSRSSCRHSDHVSCPVTITCLVTGKPEDWSYWLSFHNHFCRADFIPGLKMICKYIILEFRFWWLWLVCFCFFFLIFNILFCLLCFVTVLVFLPAIACTS